ncbi:SDR family oxidoreductase [Sporotomaculum syntrophicum]|nr:complex I NDUFA9 subunit family protein [Sporotomaculum syntrophicum]
MTVILVTGGTGLVGSHLVRALVEKGYAVRCLVRTPQKAGEVLPAGVELFSGEINDPVLVRKACQGADQVIHLVAIIREHGNQTFECVNVEGTLNLVIAAGQAGVKQFIHMSALGACDDARYIYAYSKWRGEEAVRQSGLNWTILRPSIVYGRGFNFFNRLRQALKMFPKPFVPVPGRGDTLFQPIAVEDVVKCLVQVCDNPGMLGRIIEIGGPEHLSYVQMLDALLACLGEKRYKLYVPMPMMRLVVLLMSIILQDPPVTPIELKQLDMDNTTALNAVADIFGFEPMPLHEGLKYLSN